MPVDVDLLLNNPSLLANVTGGGDSETDFPKALYAFFEAYNRDEALIRFISKNQAGMSSLMPQNNCGTWAHLKSCRTM
jgi:hypothetical protein